MADRAYRTLRDAIISHEIPPGQQLDANTIGASLGFSRAPVVEAINTLRAEGLVTSRRRIGTFASEIGMEQINEVFDARIMIEQWTAPVIVHNVSDRQIDTIRSILNQTAELFDMRTNEVFDYESFMKLDDLFHKEIVKLSERQRLQAWFDELSAHMQRVRYLYQGNALQRCIEGQSEHEHILAALAERNVEALRQTMLEHTERSRKSAAEILLQRQTQGA